MIYIAIDTCVWLELLKTDFHEPNNHFDELLFWIEKGFVKCIATNNLISEWKRHKISKKHEILNVFKAKDREIGNLMSAEHSLRSSYSHDKVEESLNKRIERMEKLFTSHILIATESNDIFMEAAKRNLDCVAPNHKKDSFRDTVNILAIKKYVIDNGIEDCIFTTINYTDYSDPDNRKNLHNQLQSDFDDAKMEYCFFDNSPGNFSGKLFREFLRDKLPPYQDFLDDLKRKEEQRKLREQKVERIESSNITDPDFVANTLQIDRIIMQEKRTELDEIILEFLFKKNSRYEQYFFKKLIENGLV